jgi:hypothetical protein
MPDPQPRLAQEVPGAPPKIGWRTRLLRVALALLTFEIGIFLIVFPWTESWGANALQNFSPQLQEWWLNPSFRGGLTGLGFANIYIACLQVVHSFRKR